MVDIHQTVSNPNFTCLILEEDYRETWRFAMPRTKRNKIVATNVILNKSPWNSPEMRPSVWCETCLLVKDGPFSFTYIFPSLQPEKPFGVRVVGWVLKLKTVTVYDRAYATGEGGGLLF